MKQRIFRTMCLLGFLGVLISGVIMIYISMRFNMYQLEEGLRENTQTIAAYLDSTTVGEGTGYLDCLPNTTRATLIDSDGTVLYESHTSAEKMENHLNRPEIQSAMSSGRGESTRQSTTFDAQTYYYAVRLSNGAVLRLASEYSNMLHMLVPSVATLCVVLIFLAFLSVVLSQKLTIWLIRPVVHLADHMSSPEEAGVYAELEPFINYIREQSNEISEQKNILKKEQEIMNTVTQCMREGVILVSGDRNLESVNPSAISMLNSSRHTKERFIGESIYLLNKNEVWISCVNEALDGNNIQKEMNFNGCVYKLYASPIVHEGAADGAVVIVLDVTQQRLAEKVRQEFSANVSHELKTPLTSISGYAEMMELDMVSGREDRIEFSRRIHKEALRLISLINDIIRLSRIEEAAPQQFCLIELSDICRDAVESLQPIAENAGVTIEVADGKAEAMGEVSLLTEVVYNLCENAIKYNHNGGHVWVSVGKTTNEQYIEIRDDGIGIPEESIPRLFERFYRVDKSRSKQTGGTGLGLSIVKHIVEYHNGRIEVRSEPNVGTRIRVFLP